MGDAIPLSVGKSVVVAARLLWKLGVAEHVGLLLDVETKHRPALR
jgi:hypothetical protein